jgi:hypothetical protein
MDRCETDPPVVPLGDRQWVRCWLYADGGSPG